VRLGTAPTKTVKEQVADFASQLRPALRKALKEFETLTRNAELCRQISPEERKQILQVELTDSDWKALIEVARNKLTKSLKKVGLDGVFENIVRPYIEDPQRFQVEYPFDEKRAKAWMAQRIIDYGWTSQRFGEFDRNVNRYGDASRSAHKVERIGKKYQ